MWAVTPLQQQYLRRQTGCVQLLVVFFSVRGGSNDNIHNHIATVHVHNSQVLTQQPPYRSSSHTLNI
jgi:hypothetical protein